MTERSTHTFQFPATQIADAAAYEADYHKQRLEHWRERYERAAVRVRETVSAKVAETAATGGIKHLSVAVNYGDPLAWEEATLAHRKSQEHRAAMERFQTDERIYRTQGERTYDLDTEDVHHFRLGGGVRDEE